MQVDWVEFPKDNLSAFVATTGYSRASYVEYEKIETLIACHLNAFNYFGGVVKEALYDIWKKLLKKVVDFWAPWCGPCRMPAPTIDQLA